MTHRDRMVYELARLNVVFAEIETVLRALPAIQRAHGADCSIPEGPNRDFFDKAGDKAWNRVVCALSGALMNGRPIQVVRQTDPRGACVQVYAPGVDAMTVEPILRLHGNGFTAEQMERICMA